MMIWNGKWFIQLFVLGLDITFVFKYVKYRQVSLPVLNCLFFIYSGNLPSYIMLNSPYTCAQFLIVLVHFLVASNVVRYSAFKRAVSLGNTFLWRLSLRYVEFSDSIAFVVYMTFLTVDENLKIGEIASQLSFQRFMEFGYLGVHFSVTLFNASNAFFSSAA